jgi:hypothetical protein
MHQWRLDYLGRGCKATKLRHRKWEGGYTSCALKHAFLSEYLPREKALASQLPANSGARPIAAHKIVLDTTVSTKHPSQPAAADEPRPAGRLIGRPSLGLTREPNCGLNDRRGPGSALRHPVGLRDLSLVSDCKCHAKVMHPFHPHAMRL